MCRSSSIVRLLVNISAVLSLSSAASAEFIYFTELSGDISRVRTDGSDHTVLIRLDSGIRGIATNDSTGELFWSNVFTDTIERVSVDERRPKAVVDHDLTFPGDLVIDTHTTKLIWQDSSVIESASLDGTNRETIFASGLSVATLDVDPLASSVFFEGRYSSSRGEIRRVNLDGTDLTTVVADVPTASSLRVDPTTETIFWTSSAGLANGDGGVYRVNYDGTGFEEIYLEGSNLDAGGLVVDSANALLYFSNQSSGGSKIIRMGLDGSNPTVIASGFSQIPDMDLSALDIDFIVPEPGGMAVIASLGFFLTVGLNRRSRSKQQSDRQT